MGPLLKTGSLMVAAEEVEHEKSDCGADETVLNRAAALSLLLRSPSC